MSIINGYILIMPNKGTDLSARAIQKRIEDIAECDVKVEKPVSPTSAKNDKLIYNKFLEQANFCVEIPKTLNQQIGINKLLIGFSEKNVMKGIGESWLFLDILEKNTVIHESKPYLKSFSFGSLVYMNTFVEHFSSAWSKDCLTCRIAIPNFPAIIFRHDVRRLEISFNVTEGLRNKTCVTHQMEIHYNMIQCILVETEKQQGNQTALQSLKIYLTLLGAPLLKVDEGAESGEGISIEDKETMRYQRTTEFGKKGSKAFCSSKVIGLSRVLKLELCSSTENRKEAWEIVEQLAHCCTKATVFFTSINKIEKQEREFSNPSISKSNFKCLFALNTLTSWRFTLSDELGVNKQLKEASDKLNEYAEKNSDALEKSLFEIQKRHEKGEIFRFLDTLDNVYEKTVESFSIVDPRKSMPSSVVELRCMLMTPTRLVSQPPIAHMKSFLLRNCDSEFAMRVTIRDDNFNMLKFSQVGSLENKTKFLKQVVAERLKKGFKVGNRKYEFFGWSTSQLRENGCFFYACDGQGKTAESMRENMGDFRQITSVAKYMARLGQSLSQAITCVHLPREFVIGPAKDIKDIDEKYTFSDGIGSMSTEVAEMCYNALKIDGVVKPSAIQIRYAGCKGMLLHDPKLEGKKIILRESMWKFNSPNESLEILKISKPQHAYLNKPFVTILEQMGVPKQVFLDLQGKQLSRIMNSLYDSEEAANVLHEECKGLNLPFKRLQQCGIDLTMEPFFRPLLVNLYKNSLDMLKGKCRIKLPFSSARTMLGVLDETMTLEYGQVFVQYSNDVEEGKPTEETTILTGTILVTKSPCMHPGDVRKFTAVNVPALEHVRDCIVFPAKGPRPHPDEMAGSDLDGDEYCLIWSEELIFQRDNFEAMDYSINVNPKVNNNIKLDDVLDFLCEYIRDDNVGIIANAHLAWADRLGIFDAKCMSIAKKYSIALDYAKSGQPNNLSPEELVESYPDFMEKFRDKNCHFSNNVLGHLFRNCKRVELISNALSADVPAVIDNAFVMEGWQKYEEDAKKSLKKFVRLFSTPLRLLHMASETEIMSGATARKFNKTFEGGNIEKNISKVLECVIPYIFKKMEMEFYKSFLRSLADYHFGRNYSDNNGSIFIYVKDCVYKVFKDVANRDKQEYFPILVEMLKKASAWYLVAYSSKQEDSSLFLGLPWVVSGLLGILHARELPTNPALQIKIGAFLAREGHTLSRMLGEQPDENTLRLSLQIMMTWLERSKGFLIGQNANLRQLKMSVLSVTRQVATPNTEYTLDNLIYMYLTRLAKGFCITQSDNGQLPAHSFFISRELGLLAVLALSSISSTGKLWDFSSFDSNIFGLSYLNKEYREEIRFQLDLKNESNKKLQAQFRQTVVENTTTVEDILKRHSKVSRVKIIFKPEKKFKFYVLVSVIGKPFNVEYLKDTIVQPSFPQQLITAFEEDC